MLRRISHTLLWIWIFLIPWQIRYIFSNPLIAGEPWEYGRISLYIGDIVFLILLIFTIAVWLKDKKIAKAYLWPTLVVILFALWSWISIIWAIEPGISAYFAARITQWLVILVIILILKPSFKLIISSILAIGALETTLGILQFGTGEVFGTKWLGMATQTAGDLGPSVIETLEGRWLRAYGTLPHPNILGGFISFALLGAIFLFGRGKSWQNPWLWALILFLGQGIVMSFSRSSWIGLVFGMIFFIILSWREKKVLKKILVSAAMLISVFALNLFIAPDIFISRLGGAGRLEAQSFTERGVQMEMALDAISEYPLGLGAGNYTAWLRELLPDKAAYIYQPVHNLYALVWSELGFIGIALFIAMIVLLFQAQKGAIFHEARTYFMASLVAMLAIGAFDHYFLTLYSGIVILGFVISLLLIKREKVGI